MAGKDWGYFLYDFQSIFHLIIAYHSKTQIRPGSPNGPYMAWNVTYKLYDLLEY